MRQLYARRVALLAATVCGFGFVFWLLAGDVLQYFSSRWPAYRDLRNEYGNWFAPDHGVSGLMGIVVRGFPEHLAFVVVGLAAFAASIVMFIRLGRGWSSRLTSKKPLPPISVAAASAVAGLVTVGFAATFLELLGWWRDAPWPVGTLHLRRLTIEPTFWLSLVLLSVTSLAWSLKLRRPRQGRDRLIQMIVITYYTFLGGALLLLTAAVLIYLRVFQVDGLFYLSGVYTGAAIGFSVMLWTLIPALVLVYKGEHYRRVREGLLSCHAFQV